MQNLQKTAVHQLTKWDARFILLSQEIAQWSKDPNKKVGALLVSPDYCKVSWGYNGLPRGIEDSEELLANKEEKNELMVHAELNCIFNATDTKGYRMYITEACCVKCAAAIIQAGVSEVIMPMPKENSSWFLNQIKAINLLKSSHSVAVTVF